MSNPVGATATQAASREALVARALKNAKLPIFVARWHDEKRRLEVGTLEKTVGKLRHDIARVLRHDGMAATVRVCSHRAARLRRTRSLEQLLRRTGRGTIVFDGTRALVRAQVLVGIAADARMALGAAIGEIYFQSERRAMYVVLSRRGRTAEDSTGMVAAAMATLGQAAARGAAVMRELGVDLAIRVGFAAPVGLDLIAVDDKSARAALLRLLRWPPPPGVRRAALGALLGASISVPAHAGGPAVSAPNVSIMTLGGPVKDDVNFEHLWAGLGVKAAIPLGSALGLQIDGGVGTDQYYGAAVHLFARDPDMGLIGVLASAESRYGTSMDRLGVEGEFYLGDNFTVTGAAGYQMGDVENGAFGKLNLKFYPDPNVMLSVGAEARPDMTFARAGFEWAPAVDSLPGLSVFGDARLADTGDYQVLFGLNFQIGAEGSLIERNRRADPETAIFNQFGYGEITPR